MKQLRVHERIHHGNYVNDRTEVIDATWDGWVALLQSSPYSMAQRDAGSNQYVAQAFAQLLTVGKASHGWATFTVLETIDEH